MPVLIFMNRTFLKLMTVVAFIGMITINALAVLLPLNGQDTGQISDLYPSYFTPAGFTFGIWSLIYLWLLVFVVAQWFYSGKSYYNKLVQYFLASCLANMAWIIAWHYLMPWVALAIMLVLLTTLAKIFVLLNNQTLNLAERLTLQFPFHIYFGWISVATIANTAAALVSVPWYGSPLSQDFWTITMLVIAALLSGWMSLRYKAFLYSLVTVWAFYGIAARWHDNTNSIIDDVAFYFILILVATSAMQLFKILKRHRSI